MNNEAMDIIMENGEEVITQISEVAEPVVKSGKGLKALGIGAGLAIAGVAIWKIGKLVVGKIKSKNEEPDEVEADEVVEAEEE